MTAWNRILERPHSIKLRRGKGVFLDSQTVRLEFSNVATNLRGAQQSTALAARRLVIIFGVQDHPGIVEPDGEVTPVPNTDIQANDSFTYRGENYRVLDVIDTHPGEIQATAEVLS